MLLLDTDHLSVLRHGDDRLHQPLLERMKLSVDANFAVCVISMEEQLRGWLAEIRRRSSSAKQVPVYAQLTALVAFYSEWNVLPFGDAESAEFEKLRRMKLRVGTQDLKIAAITLVHDAVVSTANLVDFQQVPNLRVEDWLHGRSKPK